MAENTILFRLEVDETGAAQGFRITKEELDRLRTSAGKAGAATDKTGRQMRRTGAAARSLRRAVAGIFTIATVRQTIRMADSMKNMEARLRIATDNTSELAVAQTELFNISLETFSSLESTVELYARLELSLRGQEVAQSDVLIVTEALNKAYQSAGATAQEASSSVIQLSQGLAAGALRADEYRSVMEQAPRVIQAFTDALGISRGELKAVADEGQLTTEIIVQALLEQAEAIDKDFSNITITVGKAFQNLKTEALKYIGAQDKATGATDTFAEAIVSLGENIDALVEGTISLVVGVLTGLAVKSVIAGTAVVGLRAAFVALTGPVGLTITAISLVTFALFKYRAESDDAAVSARELAEAVGLATTAIVFQDAVLTASNAIADRNEQIGELRQSMENLLELSDQDEGGRPGLAENFREGAQAMRREILILKEEIKDFRKILDAAEAGVKELADAETEAALSAEELLAAQGRLAELLAEQEDALDLATAAIENYGTAQNKIDLATAVYEATLLTFRKALIDTADGTVTLAKAEVAIRLELDKMIQEILDADDPVRVFTNALAELELQTIDTAEQGFLQLELALESIEHLLSPEDVLAYAEAIGEARLALDEFNREGENTFSFKDATAGGFFRDLKENLEEAFENGGITIGEAILKTINENPLGFANSLAGAIANFQNLKDQGATGLEALNTTIAQAEIPVVSEIAQLLGFVNDIFGGGLFGTKFGTTGSTRTIDITGAGGTGGLEIEQSKKRSFFRGTARRTLFEDLDPGTQKAISDLFQAALDALTSAVEALATTAPDFIAGKFIEEFDSDGNLTRSVSSFFGRTFDESFEEFGMRLIAENIIAAVGEATGDVEITRARTPGDLGDTFDDDFFGPGRGGGFGALGGTITETVNEAFAIAERWRDNAELLLEGAQLLLVAQAAIQDGSGLFESLTLTVDVVEELQNVGETLVDTYTRIIDSVELVTDALDLLDISLGLAREEFVRFSEEFVEAAGGLTRASSLWAAYFATFFDADDLIEAQLRIARSSLEDELEDIGLGPNVTKSQFKELFEEILPTLSADMLVEWLEAAEALGIVLQLEESLAALRIDNSQAILDSFAAARDVLDAILGSTITSLRQELLSDDDLFAELRGSALSQAGLISQAGTTGDVIDLVQNIDALVRQARGVAGDTRFNAELIEFLEQVGATAGIRLEELQAKAIADEELRLAEFASREEFVGATATFAQSVNTFAGLLSGDSGIILGDESGTPLNEQIVAGIREGFDPERMAALMENLRRTVEVFAQVTQFHAENPPSLNIQQDPVGDPLGLT